jgi:phage protein D
VPVVRAPFFEVKMEGQDITPWISAVTVVEDEKQADNCALTIADPRMIYADALFEGTTVEIDMGYAGAGEHALMLRAIITKVEMIYPDSGVPALTLKGEDKSILMGFVEKKKVWKNKKISDIVKEIVKEYGFDAAHVTAEPNPDPKITKPINQDGKTDLAFLQELAQKYHARCFVELDENGEEVLYFIPERRAVTLHRPDKLILRYRMGPESNLMSFSPAFDSSFIDRRKQLADVDKKGKPVKSEDKPLPSADVVWDLDDAALARASREDKDKIRALYDAGSQKKRALQDKLAAKKVIVGVVASDQAEIEESNDSLESRRLGQTASGATFGNIWLRAKTNVRIDGVASRFNGDWYVSSVTHKIDNNGYRTDFKAVR